MGKLSKYFDVLKVGIIKKINYLNADLYMKYYEKHLRSIGIKLSNGQLGYIDPSCHFDGSDYSLIEIGHDVTISKEVLILTHDFSLNRGFYLKNIDGKYMFSKKVTIGDNCFIGARSTLLPGTTIGNNVIIGACSVVKGKIPDDSIVCGNPAKVVCSMTEWIENHMRKEDYIRLY